ncbi:hypothetical protein ILUMI_08894 [Ignelater luminosus]|uniref:Anoctamin n=1 Tax=Ignelater luminosus TaxID=2038154 RepID=A0A8K0GGK8_IGNLU|nr:hypothetical protein ILUMI_08894 [Ignelater luminosus]
MDKNSNVGGIRTSLQRLKEGLQKTIQIFRVYESDTDDNYSGTINQPGMRPQYQNVRNTPRRSQVRFNRQGYLGSEEDLETEISAVELESDWDLTSVDSAGTVLSVYSLADEEVCDGTDDTCNSHGADTIRSQPTFPAARPVARQYPMTPKIRRDNLEIRTPPNTFRQQPRKGPTPSDSEQGAVSDSSKTYKMYVRQEQIPIPKRQVSLSSFIDYPYSVKKTPSVEARELQPPRKPVGFVPARYYARPKAEPMPLPRRDPVLPERRMKNYMIEDKLEGPINRFNYALVFPDKTNVMRIELQYLLENLERHGLELELVRGEHLNANLVFVLIHMPIATLVNEVQKQKVRLSCMLPHYPTEEPTKMHWFTMCFAQFAEIEPEVGYYSNFVTSAEKVVFIHQIVNRAKFGDEPEHYGIDEMIREEIISDAFPLHDGDSHPSWLKPLSDRQNLTAFWGRLSRFTYLQPLRLVSKYFGPEIAFYFAWLGYLSCFLTSAAIYGLFVLIASLISLSGTEDIRIKEVCNADRYMCPLCLNYEHCAFSRVKDSCFYSHTNYVFDNSYSLSYSLFLAIWTLICIIYWQRAQNALKMEWNLYHTNMENFIRSTFLRRLKEQHIETPYIGEPRIPFLWRCMCRILSMTGMIILILLVWVTVFNLILIRIALTHKIAGPVPHGGGKDNVALISDGSYASNIIVALLSGIVMIIFSKIFPFVVKGLIALESPRTEQEYTLSYTNKLFILECFNNYSYPMYMAFFREPKFTHPGDMAIWTYASGIRRNMCDPSGCTSDLSICVAIILSVKILYYWIETGIFTYRNLKSVPAMTSTEQWDSDYELTSVNYRYYITTLYIEPVMKYGLVVSFGTVLPIAPLLLLIDTAVTIRINALMFCQLLRRPVPRRVEGLEIWNGILQIVSVFGMYVFCFTTDYAKRWIHYYDGGGKSANYIWNTMTEFYVPDYPKTQSSSDISHCWFRGSRIKVDGSHYTLSSRFYVTVMYQHIFTVRYLALLLIIAVIFYFLIWNHSREKPYDETINNQEEEEEPTIDQA